MERAKFAMGLVATVALVKIAFGDWLAPTAAIAAEPGAVACEVFPYDLSRMSASERSRKLADAVGAWLATHPGQPVIFDSSSATSPIVCVVQR